MTATLWHIELSHYNEKARWALDFKGVPHRRRAPLPGTHRPVALALTRGGHGRLPILALDGNVIGDSTAIIAALEAAYPDPPLYPATAAELDRALELEEFFDEHLGPEVRRFVWEHTLGEPDAVVESLIPRAGGFAKRAFRMTVPIAGRLVRSDYAITPESAAQGAAKVRAAMDRVERELQPSGYLVGKAFSVADLTAAALFTPLLSPPERPYSPAYRVPAVQAFRDELEARPGGQWVRRMYAEHRGSSAEVRAA